MAINSSPGFSHSSSKIPARSANTQLLHNKGCMVVQQVASQLQDPQFEPEFRLLPVWSFTCSPYGFPQGSIFSRTSQKHARRWICKSILPLDTIMSKLEKAIVATVEVFKEYAGKDDDKKRLSNTELSALIKDQLSSPELKSKIDPDDISEALGRIDRNNDGEVSFKEFSQCVAQLSLGYFRKNYGKDKQKGEGKPHQ
ncbi:S100 calcium binding protein W isoform X2 [Pangasianodon hypophthalmus]|uniref:S100 calcium binding protein W isoform X2 n=1 Tax=Pangasianodon hypophthalmus TaxID=310915 RepID=UPI002307BD03|nr:S100 calcium binding protein W isoform X2 [Pangasianodon hypophthalmus]